MNEQLLVREKAALAYSTALERGDFMAVTAVLTQAAQDPILEKIILELNEAQQSEMEDETMMQATTIAKKGDGRSHSAKMRSWRRYAWPVGGVLAGLIIVFAVAFVLLSPQTRGDFSQISYDSLSTDGEAGFAVPAPAISPPMEMSAEEPPMTMATTAPALPRFDDNLNAIPAGQTVERLIIRNGTMTVVVEDPRMVRTQIEGQVAEMASQGAFVVASEEYGDTNALPNIHMTIRVPAERFDEMMNWLAETAVPNTNPNRTETAQDVTEEYVDLQARLESLTAARDRLLEIMQNAETTEELLQAEAQLTSREAEIEAIQGRMQYLEQSAALSLIDIYLNPYILNQPIETGWQPAATVRTAVESLIESMQGMVDFLIYLVIAVLPWLIVLGLVVYVVYRFIRRRRARR